MCPNVSVKSVDSTEKSIKKLPVADSVINLDHGDPMMFVDYWKKMGAKSTVVIPGWQSMSYFSDSGNLCWFLEPELEQEIKRMHSLVGNAVTEDRYIIVGTGSSQLFQAALYALSSPDSSDPINVVCAAPYYSCYPSVTDFLKSALYKWGGDAHTYDKEEPYIELITSPNNPDGFIRKPVVNNGKGEGSLIHDLAYYWPQYTAITAPAEHDLMLFTASKATGHAGMRIGWAIVKDKEVAKKMCQFMEITTIGVSKDSQLRSAKILRTIWESCQKSSSGPDQSCQKSSSGPDQQAESFFEYGQRNLMKRWEKLRAAMKSSDLFSLPEYPKEFCNFTGELKEAHPGFAWLKVNGDTQDCQSLFKSQKILTRGGKSFGVEAKYVRVSLLDREENFNIFLERLASITST